MTKKLYEVPFTATSEGRVLVMAEDTAQAKDAAEDTLGEASLETTFDDNAISYLGPQAADAGPGSPSRALKETTEIGDPVESTLDPTTEGFSAEDEGDSGEDNEDPVQDPKAKA